MYKILVTRNLPGKALSKLMEKYEVELNTSSVSLSKKEIKEKIKGKQALLCLLTDTIDREIIDSAGDNLIIISNYAVGYNNIDVEYATYKGIMVTNTPDVLTETTADLAFGMILTIARRIVEADQFTREGKFKGWEPELLLGSDVYGKTLGIIGMGRIGKAVAKRATGFNMKLIYYDIQRLPESFEREFNITYVKLEELLSQADFITIHLPLLKETHHFIGERELSLMKPSSYIINTARGAIIDEKALIKALKKERIKGAALDVYEYEPAVPEELKKMSNVLLLPHIGSATFETRSRMAEIAVENIILALEGKMPLYILNPQVQEEKT